MFNVYIVLGLGYGDEGKGLVTDYLAATTPSPLVIRFNGGQQAGHTVLHEDGRKHVFSNFGSGTLRNISTYWSRYCTFSPSHFLEEYQELTPKTPFYLDPSCIISTHYDVLYNRAIETMRGQNRHGSCGVGHGATIERCKHSDLKLVANDLLNTRMYTSKLKLIKNYYRNKFKYNTNLDFNIFNHANEDLSFFQNISKLHDLLNIGFLKLKSFEELVNHRSQYLTLIFEGAQGILLDIHYGKSPYVTKSNTTSQNALSILRSIKVKNIDLNIFYITRSYLTRHGAGPFTEIPRGEINLINTQQETNIANEFQGNFKIGYLDIDKLNYSLSCDAKHSLNLKKNLVITCLDQQISNNITVRHKGSIRNIKYEGISSKLEFAFNSCKYSFSPYSEKLKW
ncbi:MAG: adenylosuccinate synthetase [Chitinophagales bacterium]